MRLSSSARLTALVALSFVLIGSSLAHADERQTLASADASAIRAVLDRYRLGWLANDADAVRSAFTKDAVLMPHHGVAPVTGMAAISEFWWPASTAKTTIVRFVQTIDEIGGDATLAYVRGRSEVAWSVKDQGKVQHWHNHGNFMTILRKQADGGWRMSHLIWDDPPNQLEQ